MGLKLVLLLLASFLLVTTRASHTDEELLGEALALCPEKELTPVQKPVRAPVRPSPPLQRVQPPVLLPNPTVLPPTEPPVSVQECLPKCIGRCRLHLRQIRCLWACMKCCDKCKCVPPGIYGNRDKCGKCYTDMTNRRGSPMCP